MKKINKLALGFIGMGLFAANSILAQMGDLPANAQPGKCYAKCLIPDEYETVTEQILVKEGSSKLEVVPAVYETVEEQVLEKEAYKVLKVVPPTYTTVEEQMLVREAGTKLSYVPPVYETITEEMMIAPSSTKWVRGKADPNCVSANPNDCMVWCLKEIPAQYKKVTKQVVKSPASTRETPIPAEYKTVKKTVVQTPATVTETEVPAVYRTVKKSVLKSPAATRQIPIDAEYKTVSSRKMVRAGGFTEFREVLCGEKLTTGKISQIQSALKAAGFDPGPIDNVLGSRTKSAIEAFQKSKGLPLMNGDNIPVETLDALGVK